MRRKKKIRASRGASPPSKSPSICSARSTPGYEMITRNPVSGNERARERGRRRGIRERAACPAAVPASRPWRSASEETSWSHPPQSIRARARCAATSGAFHGLPARRRRAAPRGSPIEETVDGARRRAIRRPGLEALRPEGGEPSPPGGLGRPPHREDAPRRRRQMSWKIAFALSPVWALVAGCTNDECTRADALIAACAPPDVAAPDTSQASNTLACTGARYCQASCINGRGVPQDRGAPVLRPGLVPAAPVLVASVEPGGLPARLRRERRGLRGRRPLAS